MVHMAVGPAPGVLMGEKGSHEYPASKGSPKWTPQ